MIRHQNVNTSSYFSSLCEVQLEQRRVPTACYQEVQGNKSVVRFLNERCAQWVNGEKELQTLKNWSEHPKIDKECRQKIHQRVAELEYVLEEKDPLEYFRAQRADLARNLKSAVLWKTSRNHKP